MHGMKFGGVYEQAAGYTADRVRPATEVTRSPETEPVDQQYRSWVGTRSRNPNCTVRLVGCMG